MEQGGFAVKVFQTSTQFFSGVRVGDVEGKAPDQMPAVSSSGPRLTRRPSASHSPSCIATCNGADHGRPSFGNWRRNCVLMGSASA